MFLKKNFYHFSILLILKERSGSWELSISLQILMDRLVVYNILLKRVFFDFLKQLIIYNKY